MIQAAVLILARKDQLKDHLLDIMEGETTPTNTVDETD